MAKRKPSRNGKPRSPIRKPKTWGEIKTMIEEQGVTDDGPIYFIDIGPNVDCLYVQNQR